MTPASSALSISANPRSVADARQWVVDACRHIGRHDVVECAELAVSELVTNAILHGQPPISVRLGGTSLHPRIEVADGSRTLPRLAVPDPEDAPLTTVGRGLRLVSLCSEAWGTTVLADGKVVWFVPTTEPGGHGDHDPQVAYDDPHPADLTPHLEDPVRLRLLGLPAGRYRDFRRHLSELRRELRLLALTNEAAYPSAEPLAELFLLFERSFGDSVGGELAGRPAEEVVDLDVVVDRPSLATVAQLLDVLDRAEAFGRKARLLAVAPGATQRAFTRWYLGEFLDQGRGLTPTRWVEPPTDHPAPPRPRPAP